MKDRGRRCQHGERKGRERGGGRGRDGGDGGEDAGVGRTLSDGGEGDVVVKVMLR